MRSLCIVVCCLLCCVLGTSVAATEQHLVLNRINVVVWTPPASAPKPYPVLLFSHGFHGCATQSTFLLQAFAAAGYIVFAPNHADATCNGGKAGWSDRPEQSFIRVARWSSATFHKREEDMASLVAALQSDPKWRDQLDWTRLGLIGHSLGGYTALALGGAWPSWQLPHVTIKAILALSPYSSPFLRPTNRGVKTFPLKY